MGEKRCPTSATAAVEVRPGLGDPRSVTERGRAGVPRGVRRVLATLIRHLGGDFELAEDALQDAFAVALATLAARRRAGPPRRVAHLAARRKAIDRLRRERALADRAAALEQLMELERGRARSRTTTRRAPSPTTACG